MFESESDSAHSFRAAWVLHDQWDTNLAYLFREGEQIGDSVWLEQNCWVRKDCPIQCTWCFSIITFQGKLVQLLEI